MPRSSVTIRDVAARAGVSHQTVSRVINGFERINPETRQRVEQAIAALGYRPNAIARSMADGRTHTLACIAPNLTDYTFASIIEGAENRARQQGYFLLSASAAEPATFTELIEQLLDSRRTEGLLVINPYIEEWHARLPAGVPTVVAGATARSSGVASVMLDEVQAGLQATEHLLQLGHSRIAHILGPLREECSRERLTGYQQALRNAGIEPDPRWIVQGDWTATSGQQAIQQLLSSGVQFTALFAQNDRMAVGAVHALHQAHLRVPADVSVIGFDDMPLSSYFDPPLTTIRQDTLRMGSEAADLLIDAIERPDQPRPALRLPAALIYRQSTQELIPDPKGGGSPSSS